MKLCNRRDCRYAACVDKPMMECDYIGVTGHARILLCPPGDECTVYVPGDGSPSQRRKSEFFGVKAARTPKPKPLPISAPVSDAGKTCLHCCNPFESNNAQKKYCCWTCREKAGRRLKR